jgi:hypothetical protein
MLEIYDFQKKYMVSNDKMFTSPKKILPKDFVLPKNSLVHFVPDSVATIGIDFSCSLVASYTGVLYAFNCEKLIRPAHSPYQNKDVDAQRLVDRYNRSHLKIKSLKKLDRSIAVTTTPLVINYGLLPHLYSYNASSMTIYNEWEDLRTTIWQTIDEVGAAKEHFLIYKLDNKLPVS